jgi:hypothetical protein
VDEQVSLSLMGYSFGTETEEHATAKAQAPQIHGSFQSLAVICTASARTWSVANDPKRTVLAHNLDAAGPWFVILEGSSTGRVMRLRAFDRKNMRRRRGRERRRRGGFPPRTRPKAIGPGVESREQRTPLDMRACPGRQRRHPHLASGLPTSSENAYHSRQFRVVWEIPDKHRK